MRLFLALDLPEAWREGLGALGRRLRRDDDGWRWVAPASIHLTLRFLGEVDPGRDRVARDAWAAAAAGVGEVTLASGGLGCFPAGGRPRVLWVAVREPRGAGRLARLALALERAAVGAGFPAEPRAFRPHLTLARARRPRPAAVLADAGFELSPARIEALTLFRSDLGAGGARYTVLERFPLGDESDMTVAGDERRT